MAGAKNKSIIGAFVVGAVALAVVAVFMLGSGMLFAEKAPVVLYFEGSVGGLSVGAPVVFRGVQIGQVKQISIEAMTKPLRFSIPVVVEIAANQVRLSGHEAEHGFLQTKLSMSREELFKELIKHGLRGVLSQKSFVTGELQIMLDFYPDSEAVFRGDGKMMELPTVPSAFEKLAKSLENLPLSELVSKILSAVNGVDALVNSKHMQAMPAGLEELIKDSRGFVDKLDKEIGPLVKRANEMLGSYDKLANHVDGKVDPLVEEARKVMSRLDKALDQAKETLAKIERTAGPDSSTVSDLRRALSDISAMARSIRTLSDFLERHPEALIQGKGPRR